MGTNTSINVEFEFCMAHRLLNHPGKCKNLHGHNYIGHVVVEKTTCMEKISGMVADFGYIKDLIKSVVHDKYDHKTCLQNIDPLLPVLKTALPHDTIVEFPVPPTAEYLAKAILFRLQEAIANEPIMITQVEIYETEKQSAVVAVNELEDMDGDDELYEELTFDED